MEKIFIVKYVWAYYGCPEDFPNCREENIEKIFRKKENAISFIKNKLIGENTGKHHLVIFDDNEKYNLDNEMEIFVGIPTDNDILENKLWFDLRYLQYSTYIIEEYDVE